MKDKKYIIFLVAVFAIYVITELAKPTPINWTATYHFNHKIPFGTYATHDLMKDMFDGNAAEHSNRTIYELIKEEGTNSNLLVMADRIALDQNDLDALLSYVDEGHSVLLNARGFDGPIMDSLGFGFRVKDPLLTYDFEAIQENLAGEATESITFTPGEGISKTYQFSNVATTSSINRYKSDNFNVLATDESDNPVLLEYKGLKGRLFISTMPLAMTNYFVLNEGTSEFAASLLSLFPEDEPLMHNEYYHLGRMESQTPLRVVLANRSLRWAMFILLFTLVIFLIFESKRRQRIIPLITPLKNLSVEFVETLGRLYYRQSDHKKLAQKRVAYWKDFIRRNFNQRTDQVNESFAKELANKSGQDLKSVNILLDLIKQVETGKDINQSELMRIEKYLNAFYGIE